MTAEPSGGGDCDQSWAITQIPHLATDTRSGSELPLLVGGGRSFADPKDGVAFGRRLDRTPDINTLATQSNVDRLHLADDAAPEGGRLRERSLVHPEAATIRGGQAVTNWVTRRPALRRAFCVLDPEGRTRTGISPLDRRSLYQLSYLGVVPEV